jgi:hypothetical protein
MDAGSSHDVLVWGVRRYKGKRKTTYMSTAPEN